MRVLGFCTECHKFRPVRTSGHALVMAAARGRPNIPDGVCVSCEEDAEKKKGQRR